MTDIGDDIILQVELRTRLGVLADPTIVSGWVKDPTGDIIPVTFTKIRTGIWEAVYSVVDVGEHWWRFESSGNGIKAAGERHFTVDPQKVVHT